MGQQQLLLLVLSTVIVGLATVAGIQAFSENQEQATRDALSQRALTIASDINALAAEPTQMGGVDTTASSLQSTVVNRAGYETVSITRGQSSTTGIAAPGAGDGAGCTIGGSDPVEVTCTSPDLDDNVVANTGPNPSVSFN
jgi:hypothetical protein